MMKRFAAVLAGAWVTVVVLAGVAFAADGDYPPVPNGGTSVEGNSGGTAFTGSDVNVAMIAIVVLLALGVVALLIARRRAARLAS